MLKALDLLLRILTTADFALAFADKIQARRPQLEQMKANGESVPLEFWDDIEGPWMTGEDTPLDDIADRARANEGQ